VAAIPSYYYCLKIVKGKSEIQQIKKLFLEFHVTCAQATVSEYIDIHNYKISKNKSKIRSILKSNYCKAFEFVHCLN
jgi:translation elongation factor EF-1alpha